MRCVWGISPPSDAGHREADRRHETRRTVAGVTIREVPFQGEQSGILGVMETSARERLELIRASHWRAISATVLAVVVVALAAGLGFLPLGVVGDTECGSLFEPTTTVSCDDRFGQRRLVFLVVGLLGVALVAFSIRAWVVVGRLRRQSR